MDRSVLLLQLVSDIQAWGLDSKFDFRGTNRFPTKSAIIGLISAALGIDKYSSSAHNSTPSITEQLSNLSTTVSIYINDFTLGADRMIDLHTVGANFNKDIPEQRGRIPVTAKEGKSKENAVVTHREYLLNHLFGVFIMGQKDLLKKIENALINPKWGVWLGRKCCIPTAPILLGIFESFEKAKDYFNDHLRAHYPKYRYMGAVKEILDFSHPGVFVLPDIPVSFKKRKFHSRLVVEDADF